MTNPFRAIWRRLRAVVRPAARDREIDEEMRFHLEMEVADLIRGGLAPDEARRHARIAFGGVERHKEAGRDVVGVRWLEDFVADLHYAVHQLRSSPGFAAATLITLALGVGATTTMFGLARIVAFPPLPFPRAEQLVYLRQMPKGCDGCQRMAAGNYFTLRSDARSLASVSLIGEWNPILRGAERAEILGGARVTPELFQTFGVGALLGRTLVPDDTLPERQQVVVIGERTWHTRFAQDSAIVGRTIVLDGAPVVVVGIVADSIGYPRGTEVWTPKVIAGPEATERGATNYTVVGRLRDGVSLTAFQAELSIIGQRVAAEYSGTMSGWVLDAIPLKEWSRRNARETVIFGVAVVFVLLIACSNLAGLLIARLTARRRELAVRAALGASAGRLARQVLAEMMLVAAIGGVLGGIAASVSIPLIRDAVPSDVAHDIPGWFEMRMDVVSFLVALATGAVTGIAIGLWPALRFGKPDLVEELRDASRTATSRSASARLRRTLVVAQVAFAIVLLSAAGLLARSAQQLYAEPAGFDTEHVLTMRVQAPRTPSVPIDPERFDRLARAIEALPGVMRAGATFALPYGSSMMTNGFEIEGEPPVAPNRRHWSRLQPATFGYLEALRLPVLQGRSFEANDRAGSPRVAIVNQALVRRYFKNGSPIGRGIIFEQRRWEIVGVVGDVMYGGGYGASAGRRDPEIYRPMQQWPMRTVGIVVRTQGDPLQLAQIVGNRIRELDPDLAITHMKTMETMHHESTAPYRIMGAMMLGFALAAMLISAIGLYGVISHAVAQRTREFGVRLALGADATSLLQMVLAQGLKLAVLGGAIGIVGALGLTRVMRFLLYRVSAADPATYALVSVGVAAVAIAASYVPARRAARVDAMTSLRTD